MASSSTYLTVSLTGTKEVAPNDLAALYRDWTNNYLSVARFAEDYGVSVAQAEVTIAMGRAVHDAHASWLKEFARSAD